MKVSIDVPFPKTATYFLAVICGVMLTAVPMEMPTSSAEIKEVEMKEVGRPLVLDKIPQVECSKCPIARVCPTEKYTYKFPDVNRKTANCTSCPLAKLIADLRWK